MSKRAYWEFKQSVTKLRDAAQAHVKYHEGQMVVFTKSLNAFEKRLKKKGLKFERPELPKFTKDYAGIEGISGFSGFSGVSGISGYSGASGFSGYSGTRGTDYNSVLTRVPDVSINKAIEKERAKRRTIEEKLAEERRLTEEKKQAEERELIEELNFLLSKLRAHNSRLLEYARWLAVLSDATEKNMILDREDWEFFFGSETV